MKRESLQMKNEETSKPETRNGSVKGEVLKAMLALAVGLILATYTYYLGVSKGAEGKKAGFENIPTDVKLDGSKWKVEYEDIDALGAPMKSAATLEFNQFGSRIVGEGWDSEGRHWIVEGAIAERRICYIYYDRGGKVFSIGTVILEYQSSGNEMSGQWAGWGPSLNDLKPRKVTLKRL